MSGTQTVASEVDLKNVDFIILIDQSGSMGEAMSQSNSKSRWDYMSELATGLAGEASKYDDDGIGVYVFNEKCEGANNCGKDKVKEYLSKHSPKGSTSTGNALSKILKEYREARDAGKTTKNLGLYVFTDGAASDRDFLAQQIIDHTKWMKNDSWTGIAFIQVGEDPAATELLNYLDNGLESKGAKYDIVSTVTPDQWSSWNYDQIFTSAFTS